MRKTLAICFALWLGVMPVIAKNKVDIVPPGNWAAVGSLQNDTAISVRMTSGDRMEGKFHGLDAESIRLMMDKQERIFPRNCIAEVWQLRVPDRKRNGTLIGMAAGAAVGFSIAAANGAFSEGGDTAAKEVYSGFALVSTGLGALLGLTVDVLIKGDRLLYRK